MDNSRQGEAAASGWEHFHHVADIGVRGRGTSPSEAFEQVALALSAVICEPEAVEALEPVEIDCEAPDLDYLLLDWLNALVYEMATRRMLFSRFRVAISGYRLQATAWGEPVEVGRHRPATEVKGATLTELEVAETAPGRWLAQCVVDV